VKENSFTLNIIGKLFDNSVKMSKKRREKEREESEEESERLSTATAEELKETTRRSHVANNVSLCHSV